MSQPLQNNTDLLLQKILASHLGQTFSNQSIFLKKNLLSADFSDPNIRKAVPGPQLTASRGGKSYGAPFFQHPGLRSKRGVFVVFRKGPEKEGIPETTCFLKKREAKRATCRGPPGAPSEDPSRRAEGPGRAEGRRTAVSGKL